MVDFKAKLDAKGANNGPAVTTKPAAPVAPDTALATVKASAVAVADYAPDEIEALGEAGQENVTAANTLLPRLTILQSLSPQIKKAKVEFVAGAEEGDWCDVSVGEIWKGSVEVIPCFFSTQYIQWKKNRGGLERNWGTDVACLKETFLNEKRENILPNGDSIVETATWYCLLHAGSDWRRVFLPLSKTGLKVSRKWLTILRAERLLGKNGPFTPPLFYRPWTLTVAHDSNDQGDWYTPIPAKSPREEADISTAQPDRFKTIYHLMAEMNDSSGWLLKECKRFYEDARDNLVVGDMGTDDMNDPTNAKIVGSGSTSDKIIDQTTSM